MTKKETKELSLEAWMYLAEHPKLVKMVKMVKNEDTIK
jgi:hypothetical protein